MTKALWEPSSARIESTLLSRYMQFINLKLGTEFRDYDDLWQWSVSELDTFWDSLWTFFDVIGHREQEVVRNPGDPFNCEFFPGAKLNYAEHLLRFSRGDKPALIFHHESGRRTALSYADLYDQVSVLQQALESMGVKEGDRVAGFLPNLPQTAVAMLATTSLGAVWSSCSPDFGLNGLMDRFGQIEPKVLFTADGYTYNGKTFDSLDVVAGLAHEIESIQHCVVIPFISEHPDIDFLGGKGHHYQDLADCYSPRELQFTRVDFRAPLFILFSSGTTGLPKCFVHSVGGTLLHHLKEHQLQCDIQPGDRLLYFTTCGWAMWNWQVSALASGASLVLYEGSPFYPDADALPAIVAAEAVTHFGTSAKYLDACNKKGLTPKANHDFSELRTMFSTGSPLSKEGFQYVYDSWKSDLCLSSISGGTDIIGCFVGGNPIGPVYAGQSQKRHLGMDVQVFDENGQPVQGVAGELVCLSPHPAMPIGFLNDPDRQRYFNEYFAKYEHAWCHSDWVELTPEQGMIFFGRSDATLNPGGVRIGTSEIYRQVENIDEVLESVVIGQDWDNDVRVILFVVLKPDVSLTEELERRIRAEIRSNATPRHVPAKIIAVADIPRTHSGKITELAVRNVVHGRPVKNVESLANPDSLRYFKDLEVLQV
ncbi:acetoacetate--CoA ligase [Ketobacter sp.]|uniref:acetoacetate--CoA ligase n=1 Tax=Ketobacter sp. TaxID=2083498 RepID=UPI000F171598|nr:acetoacetate--CoA ligase [Ketobacter sp.]RLT98723.1 MAG: acetoacetate--CoA ligase [Ketobacter sp.]